MKFLDEYRDGAVAQRYAAAIARAVTRPWTIMEVCGGQTHAIVKFGIDELLPRDLVLIHGPGCPVCVTPVEMIDKAIDLAGRAGVILCSFGDMLRVPGSRTDLMSVKASGGDVRVVYSPLDAVRVAHNNRGREVVFFAVGFETTAPSSAVAVCQAKRDGLGNFTMLVSHVLVPPAIEAILSSPLNQVRGFLAAGHVCTVMGMHEYVPIARRYRVPIVVTGFEPVDILQGILLCVRQLEISAAEVHNQYARSVRLDGNKSAQAMIKEVFRAVDRVWRGIGVIGRSGLSLNEAYAGFDAEKRFGLTSPTVSERGECISGLILQGIRKPPECPAFGARCTPEHPLGAPMVSNEGACAAYHRYRPWKQNQKSS